jgi:hypothetical protein
VALLSVFLRLARDLNGSEFALDAAGDVGGGGGGGGGGERGGGGQGMWKAVADMSERGRCHPAEEDGGGMSRWEEAWVLGWLNDVKCQQEQARAWGEGGGGEGRARGGGCHALGAGGGAAAVVSVCLCEIAAGLVQRVLCTSAGADIAMQASA